MGRIKTINNTLLDNFVVQEEDFLIKRKNIEEKYSKRKLEIENKLLEVVSEDDQENIRKELDNNGVQLDYKLLKLKKEELEHYGEIGSLEYYIISKKIKIFKKYLSKRIPFNLANYKVVKYDLKFRLSQLEEYSANDKVVKLERLLIDRVLNSKDEEKRESEITKLTNKISKKMVFDSELSELIDDIKRMKKNNSECIPISIISDPLSEKFYGNVITPYFYRGIDVVENIQWQPFNQKKHISFIEKNSLITKNKNGVVTHIDNISTDRISIYKQGTLNIPNKGNDLIFKIRDDNKDLIRDKPDYLDPKEYKSINITDIPNKNIVSHVVYSSYSSHNQIVRLSLDPITNILYGVSLNTLKNLRGFSVWIYENNVFLKANSLTLNSFDNTLLPLEHDLQKVLHPKYAPIVNRLENLFKKKGFTVIRDESISL